jgi:2-polyprenyl-3-methyl-5-hydroxy-6-metoxy-1,4-benzoquinol methylase
MKTGIGVDIDEENIKYCKSLNLNAKTMKVNQLDFNENSFETVILDNVLEHIKDPNELLIAIKKVLKLNCKLIIGVPGTKGYAYDNDHKIFYDKEKLKNLLKKYGFELEYDFYSPINNIYFDNKFRQFCLYAIFKKI